MTDLTDMTITQALKDLEKGHYTAEELTQAHIKASQDVKHLNAYVTETYEKALEMAKASDTRRQKGQIGFMEGIPIAVKDLFCTQGVRTTASSKILDNFIPPYESTVTQNLWAQGAVMLGKVAMDEFAMGSSTETNAYGTVISPWKANDSDADLVPGGSSGGSTAIVAARGAMAATGSDTNGSIRYPAALTGITGLKPTYGRCSRWGMIAFASSLDQAGPITRSVEDAAIMLRAMASYDPKDSTSVDQDVPDYTAGITDGVKGLKIGIPKEYRDIEGLDPEVANYWDKTIEWLKEAGAEIVDISMPHAKYSVPAYYIIAPAEASSNLARYDGMRYGLRVEGDDLTDTYEKTRAAGFGPEVQRRIMIGTYALSSGYYDAYYIKAQKVRTLVAQDFVNAYEKCDAILTPTGASSAFAIGEKISDPVAMYLTDIFTSPTSLAGLPGISVPVGLDKRGLPLGMQIIGRAFDEKTMLRVAHTVEKAAAFSAKPAMVSKKAA